MISFDGDVWDFGFGVFRGFGVFGVLGFGCLGFRVLALGRLGFGFVVFGH